MTAGTQKKPRNLKIARLWQGFMPALMLFLLERIPSWLVGVFEVADTGAEAGANSSANGRQFEFFVGLEADPDATNEIGRTFNADEAIEDVAGGVHIIYQNQGARSGAAKVKADGRSLPEDFLAAAVFHVKRAFAKAQAANKSSGAFFTNDVAIWPAGTLERVFDCLSQALGGCSKKLVSRTDNFLGRKCAVFILCDAGRHRVLRRVVGYSLCLISVAGQSQHG